MNTEELINFAFLYDDKKMSLEDLEKIIIEKIENSDDIDKIKIFYLNHLDLFIKYQNRFKNVIRNQVFLDDYMKYRNTFADIEYYIHSLELSTDKLSTPTSTPTSTTSKSSFSGFFEKKYPTLSIFNSIDPEEFSKICHKIYLSYYFLTEIREYQFYSRVSTRELHGYARDFETFYDNFYRKMESEIEIFCEDNQLSLLADTFMSLSKSFLDMGNIPFAHTCISLMNRFKICKENKIQEFLNDYNLSLPLNPLSLANYKKFTYLVDPGSINRAFITAHEVENKIKTFSFIQTKMIKTKEEILLQNITSTKIKNNDYLVFNYINPKIMIKEKLYKSSTPGGLEYFCIKQKCKSQSGGNTDENTNSDVTNSYKFSSKLSNDKNAKNDFIWENISPQWQDKLLSSNFFIKNCLADGNCQFRSIETALSNVGYKLDHKKLRNIIVKYINNLDNKIFFNIIQNYRIEKDNGEFIGNWDPYTIRNKRNFINEIKKEGFHFQGDHTTLNLISNALNIHFIILTSDYHIINLSKQDDLYNQIKPHKLIILYYNKIDNNYGHYQTIGFKSKRKVETIFQAPFPTEIENLLEKEKLLASHLNHILNGIDKSKKLQVNNILMSMQKKLHQTISLENKHTIMLFLTFWLKDNKYFETDFSNKPVKKQISNKNSPKKKSPKKKSPKTNKRSNTKQKSKKRNSPKKYSIKKNSIKKLSSKK